MTSLIPSNLPYASPSTLPTVKVAVGLLLRNFPERPQILMAERTGNQHYAGFWEFPGGKLEAGEHADTALSRELTEELAIHPTLFYRWGGVRQFVYPHAHVHLFFYRITEWEGTPEGAEGQTIEWFDLYSLPEETILPANRPLLRFLRAPITHLITDVARYGEKNLLKQLKIWLDQPTPFSIQIRDKTLSENERKQWGHRVLSLVKNDRNDCPVLWNGSPAIASSLGFDGVHCPQNIWTAPDFVWPEHLPLSFWKSAACHTSEHISRIEQLHFDSATYSPVKMTTTHPHTPALGWNQFETDIQQSIIPIYALGGLHPGDITTAFRHGAHGIALCSSAWESTLS